MYLNGNAFLLCFVQHPLFPIKALDSTSGLLDNYELHNNTFSIEGLGWNVPSVNSLPQTCWHQFRGKGVCSNLPARPLYMVWGMLSTKDPLRSTITSGHFLSLGVFYSLSATALVGLSTYFEFHHITKLEEIIVSGKTFPAITSCNINPLRKSKFTACNTERLREMWGIPAKLTGNITSSVYEMNRETLK